MNISLVLQGVLGSILSDGIFFSFFFSRFFLIPSQSASLYIIANFEVYLIDENNYPHVLVVLFQKSYTDAKHIDMPLLYSISSPKSMTDICGSSNFRLSVRGGGGGRTEYDRKRPCQLFGPETCIDYHSTQINLVK